MHPIVQLLNYHNVRISYKEYAMLQSKIDDYGKTSSLLNFHEKSLTICVDIQVCELLFLSQIKSRQIEKKTFFF